MEKRLTILPGADMILIDGNKVLLMLRKNTFIDDDMYGIPSGHMEGEESPLEAAIREAKEETGVDVDPSDAKFIHTLYKVDKLIDDQIRVNFTFLSTKWVGEPQILEKDKCGGIKWFELDKLPENLSFHARHVLEQYMAGNFYSYIKRG